VRSTSNFLSIGSGCCRAYFKIAQNLGDTPSFFGV
jgi:hypothetical protein